MEQIIEVYFYDRTKTRDKNLLAQTVIPNGRNIPNIGDDVEINGNFCKIEKIVYDMNFTRIDFLVTVKGVRLHR